MEQHTANFMRRLYCLFDFFPENDPLTIKLKERTIAILEQLAKPNAGAESYHYLLCDVSSLETYLNTARELGWMNSINTLIAEKEISQLKNCLAPLARRSVDARPLLILPKPAKKEKKHSKRQQKILEIMAGREKTQVSDIVKQLPDVTKRTIRRDIDELLGQSKIVRFGEFNQVFYKVGHK